MYPNSGYEGIYVYAKTSLIYSFIPQDLVFVKQSDGEISISVSYTHLDVYKRQIVKGLNRPTRRP